MIIPVQADVLKTTRATGKKGKEKNRDRISVPKVLSRRADFGVHFRQ